jgi:hypothetical protein
MEVKGNTHLKAGGMDLALWVVAVFALAAVVSAMF